MREDGTKDILLHAAELEERCDYAPAVSDFLTVAEQVSLTHIITSGERLFFWGAFPEAERKCAVFLPEWALTEPLPCKDPLSPEKEKYLHSLVSIGSVDLSDEISLIRINGSGHGGFSHRDVLGALMGLGIARKKVGDICPISTTEAVVALSSALVPFISENLISVGRDSVTVSLLSNPAAFSFERKFEEIFVTVASMRLDCIVSAVTGMSRTSSADAIVVGSVQVLGTVCDNISHILRIGDTIAVRGHGKYLVAKEDGLSKKSRIRLTLKKYL